MDLNQHDDYETNPDDINLTKMSEAERQIQFRKKRQQYLAQKISRKKQLMKLKKQQFGSSSSDESADHQQLSHSSKSSHKQSKIKQLQDKNIKQSTHKKHLIQHKQLHTNLPKKLSDTLEKINIYLHSNKGNQWLKDFLIISQKTITLQNITQQIKNFAKVKIIAQPIQSSPYRLKINTLTNQQYLFSLANNQQILNLPSHYYIFAKFIQQKLLLTNIKSKQNITQKIQGLPQDLKNGALIYGKIGKKSQVLGNWEQRFILINKQGIFSYKKFNQKYSMHIANGTIKQLWTRFQIQDKWLVIKIWHGGKKKTQFGFPITDFLTLNNWLFGFYSMMPRGK